MTGVQEAVAPVFGTILFFYGGQPFLAGAVSGMRTRQPGMMTLIALAISRHLGRKRGERATMPSISAFEGYEDSAAVITAFMADLN